MKLLQKVIRINKKYDFIIIGAGQAGLSMGALLANKGKKILIIERAKYVGGRSRVMKKNGFEVDYGIHLSRGGASSVFKELGMKLRRKGQDLSGGIIIVDKGIPYNALKHVRFFLKNKVITLPEINKSLRYFLATLLKRHKNFYDLSVGKWLDSLNATKGIRDLFQLITFILLICPDLYNVSLGELMNVVKTMNIRGVARGTFKQIFHGLVTKIKENEGEFKRSTRVDKILIDEKTEKAIGVLVKDEKILADNVIVATTPPELLKLVDNKFLDALLIKKIQNIKPTCGISIDYGLKKKVSNNMGFFMRNPPIMGFFENDEGIPEGKQLLSYLLLLDSPKDFENKQLIEEKTRVMEKIIKAMYPNLEENIEWRRLLNIKMIDGVQLNTRQSIDKRIDNIIPKLKNVFIIGDATNAPGAGGDVAFNSALQLYKKLKKMKKV